MRLALAALLVVLAGCDSAGIEERGICLIGDQPALRDNEVSVRLASPSNRDTLYLGEAFRLRGTLQAVGPDIRDASFRFDVVRLRRNDSVTEDAVLLSTPLRVSRGVTDLDQSFAIGRLPNRLTSRDLDADETLAVSLRGDITFPVESDGPGCGTTESGRSVRIYRPVTILYR